MKNDNSLAERGPLDGYLVVDFTQVVAGPLATMQLADLGSRVVKIEPPSGDKARQLGKPGPGYKGTFETFNRGKESVVADAPTPNSYTVGHLVELPHSALSNVTVEGPGALLSQTPGCRSIALHSWENTTSISAPSSSDTTSRRSKN